MTKTGKQFNCQTCEKEFYRALWQIKRNEQKFCSLACRKHTKEAKRKMSLAKVGKPSWNKGLNKIDDPRLDYVRPTAFKDEGKTDENMKIRKSTAMRRWRTRVFKRDDYTCQECGDKSRAGHRVELNADHIKPFCLFKELRFELSNGRTLCVDCHRKTESWGRKALEYGTNYYGVATLDFS